ncbi:MAG: hypothetical protein HUU50_13875 [Candidatus Brocadiae bacterium]|nr:hypothetical protein [Candidatus Brocadiia bacterium]
MKDEQKTFYILHKLAFFLFFIASGIISYDLWKENYAQGNKPYQKHWQYPVRWSSMPDKGCIQEYIHQYKKILEINPENPIHWQEMAHWCLLFLERSQEDSAFWLAYTEEILTAALKKMPAHGRSYFLLGKVYARQAQWKEADKAMITAQVLSLNKKELAYDIAEYWRNRYVKTLDSFYIPLLADRLLFLNQLAFFRYQEKTLSLWQALFPGVSAWGKIIPETDYYAWETAHFFWKKKDFVSAKQYLSYIQGDNYASDKNFLEAKIALQEKKLENALDLFQKALDSSKKEKKESLALQSAQMLFENGFIQQSMLFLKKTTENSILHRLSILNSLVSNKQYSQALPMLEEIEKECKQPYPHLLDFLLSQCYWSAKEIIKSVTHAENAFLKDYSQEKYANHFFEILFAVNMEEKVSYYLEKYGTRLSRPSFFYYKLACQYETKKKIHSAWYWIQKAYQSEPDKLEIQDKLKKIKALKNQ